MESMSLVNKQNTKDNLLIFEVVHVSLESANKVHRINVFFVFAPQVD